MDSPNGIVGAELHEEPDHQGREKQEAGGAAQVRNELRQGIQLQLQRRALR